ncbi:MULTISPECIES: 3-hydroxyacyl-CoA dehydrogenase/enoyl-CoA hydratase family protein [unclassified Leptolyngbya]|uniref:3-hydroxyacyl-CoA dehydrogenase/enoyl-CoA hydratase family protein n=1 Tax=unclassified Leptolyngbya TaxID=2650499 RepID=UPI0016879161|nr:MULTISPECIES: 3-hydroxyacyl-CoA dehydrogenase/enoyl-CoA hydratase family protein [unclassified Leptolyngbya]MBD1910490.1 enoyl-CoA hydratase/isomerase family protein [Leptolyngbya sp. FACHB-8]MBD2153657.1 enoyl-CoA hydratase/isomerase family protein [Leptolyngbya sp. FACHB-16]
MFKPFRTAAVLGAGVMGTQIAAHLANAGLTVHLLELPAQSGDRNSLVEGAFKKALKQSPPVFYTEQIAQRVILGNYEDHFDRLAQVDWVIEVVVENLAVKQQLMERVEKTVRPDTVISSNTSGLSIGAIAQHRSKSFRKRFLGTHFFNPPRYLKLLELIPTADTDPEVLARMQWFGRMHLGKGIVIAKDTPNFIANRIGVFVTMLGLKALTEQGYTIEEIDQLTGTVVGRPKSATFRTADLVGLDTLTYVSDNLYPVVPNDEQREMFRIPELMRKLTETGSLGAKVGQGFYKKVKGEIHSVNIHTLAYEPAKPMNLGNLDGIAKLPDLSDRLRKLYHQKGRAGDFFRQTTLATLAYSANRIPEIADRPIDVDQAMRWGFGWEMGPFEIWDALGFEMVRADMQKAGLTVPDWVMSMSGGFYGQVGAIAAKPIDEIHLADIKANPKATLWHNSEAALLDLGDGVTLFEFRSKANTLSVQVIDGLIAALDWLETHDYRGMVIGNEGENFCVGINLAEVGKIVQWENLNPFNRNHRALTDLIIKFQTLVQRIHYFHKPIVAAIQGRVLGGGCELAMACPHIVADAETYIGLVELGVGLIPAGGGLMRMARWAASRAATDTPGDILPFLKRVFETIGMAKVANSAYEGVALGFLNPMTKVVVNGDRRLYVAKQEVLDLDYLGYTAPPRNPIHVLGQPARAVFEHMAQTLEQGGYISEYDHALAHRLAYVLTGGELTASSLVDEDYLLRLERELFLPLVDEPKTKERILHMLTTKKPLRN